MKRAARYSVAAAAVAILAAGAWILAPQPTQLSVTPRAGDDTVVINQMHSAQLFASVVDQYGRHLRSDTALRYRRVGGDSINLSATGQVMCEKSQDAMVQAAFKTLVKNFVVRCRPVASIDAPSWINLVVGDEPRNLSFTAYGPDGRVVTELRGDVSMLDASVAGIQGMAVRPRRAGQTMASVEIGDAKAFISILVHQLVSSFVDNRPNDRLLAMRVALARGDTVEFPLPKAAFWVTYFSANRLAVPPTIELRGNGSCTTGDGIHLQRIEEGEYAKYCLAGTGAKLMIAHGAAGADLVKGTVALHLVW
jgi:hypothetical protein